MIMTMLMVVMSVIAGYVNDDEEEAEAEAEAQAVAGAGA